MIQVAGCQNLGPTVTVAFSSDKENEEMDGTSPPQKKRSKNAHTQSGPPKLKHAILLCVRHFRTQMLPDRLLLDTYD